MMPDRNPILSYDTEQRIRALLAKAATTDGLTAPEGVERALVTELRRRNRRMLAVRLCSAGALAAAVLVGLYLTRPSAQVAPAVQSADREVTAPPPVPAVAPALRDIAKAASRQTIRRRAPKPAPRQLAAMQQTEFIPVGPWQAIEPMERGSIIRVRLPKSSLPGFGIPVSADRWNESIPADVVLGEDGSMRAVRFVSTRQ
jgi:hypothetical protein